MVSLKQTVISLTLMLSTAAALAQNSTELSCRSRAKEIAAETYKGCMTDYRQTQLEQIRKDYKEKLAEVKAHYDKELKKVSGGQNSAPASTPLSSDDLAAQQSQPVPTAKRASRQSTRASGARNLPAKKTPVRTQVIDLSTPAEPSEEVFVKSEQDDANQIEIVELPSQE